MPRIGFGTAGLGLATESSLQLAIEAGYRHIDTAQVGPDVRGLYPDLSSGEFTGTQKLI